MGNLLQKGLVATFLLASVALATPASALPFVVADWLTPGDGLVTVDPATGLEWLDITETAGRSYTDVSNRFGAGQRFEGWRYANDAEVETLFANAGIPLGSTISYIGNANALSFLRDYSGFFYPPTDFYIYLQGLLDGVYNSESRGLTTLGYLAAFQVDVYSGVPETYAVANFVTFDVMDYDLSIGSFLVRESLDAAAVPEPASVLLWTVGVTALGAARLDGTDPLP